MKRKYLNLLASICMLAIVISLFIPNFALYGFGNVVTKTPASLFNFSEIYSMLRIVGHNLALGLLYFVDILQLCLAVLALGYFVLTILDFCNVKITKSKIIKKIIAYASLSISIIILLLCIIITASNIVSYDYTATRPAWGKVKYVLIGLCSFFSIPTILGSVFALITNSTKLDYLDEVETDELEETLEDNESETLSEDINNEENDNTLTENNNLATEFMSPKQTQIEETQMQEPQTETKKEEDKKVIEEKTEIAEEINKAEDEITEKLEKETENSDDKKLKKEAVIKKSKTQSRGKNKEKELRQEEESKQNKKES